MLLLANHKPSAINNSILYEACYSPGLVQVYEEIASRTSACGPVALYVFGVDAVAESRVPALGCKAGVRQGTFVTETISDGEAYPGHEGLHSGIESPRFQGGMRHARGDARTRIAREKGVELLILVSAAGNV